MHERGGRGQAVNKTDLKLEVSHKIDKTDKTENTTNVNMEASVTEVWSLLCNGSKLSRDQGEERLKELLNMQDDGRGEREERLAQQLRHLAKNHAAENREASVSKFILCGFPIEMWKL